MKNDNYKSNNDAAIEAIGVCVGIVEGLVYNTKEKSSPKQAHKKFLHAVREYTVAALKRKYALCTVHTETLDKLVQIQQCSFIT